MYQQCMFTIVGVGKHCENQARFRVIDKNEKVWSLCASCYDFAMKLQHEWELLEMDEPIFVDFD